LADLLRTFFAVEIRDGARRQAADVSGRLAAGPGGDAVRWVRPEAFHVTLRFLGQTPRDRIAPLVAAAREATRAIAPFTARLGALGGFPERRPRVVTLDVLPAAPLTALAQALEAAAVAAGFEPVTSAYHPHVTLGRVKHRAGRAPILHAEDGPADSTPFDVASYALFQSVLAPGGSQYTPLERIPLVAAF
jgi:2'-5' RNA ligase